MDITANLAPDCYIPYITGIMQDSYIYILGVPLDYYMLYAVTIIEDSYIYAIGVV